MVSFALCVIGAVVAGVLWLVVAAHQSYLVSSGQADYFVKIAASGRGKTYHAPS
jgi:hypothetical protein